MSKGVASTDRSLRIFHVQFSEGLRKQKSESTIARLGVRYRRGRKSKSKPGNANLSAAADNLRNANREIGVPGVAPVSAIIAKLGQSAG